MLINNLRPGKKYLPILDMTSSTTSLVHSLSQADLCHCTSLPAIGNKTSEAYLSMASDLFNKESNGKRITTDILVCGYIADVSKQYQLLIPDEIKRTCFVYWRTIIQMHSMIEQVNVALGRYYEYMGNISNK